LEDEDIHFATLRPSSATECVLKLISKNNETSRLTTQSNVIIKFTPPKRAQIQSCPLVCNYGNASADYLTDFIDDDVSIEFAARNLSIITSAIVNIVHK